MNPRIQGRSLLAPTLAIVAGLAIGAAIMIANGDNPIDAYAEMVAGAFGGRSLTNLVSSLNRATPIVGLAVAAAVAFRAGLFNIGLEGQLVAGGLASAVIGLYAPLDGPLLLVAALVGGALAGGAVALLAAFLDLRLGVPILIGSLLLNFPVRQFASWAVASPLRQEGSSLVQTPALPDAALIGGLPGGTRLHWGIVIVALACAAVWLLVSRSVAGYELRMSGLNKAFARVGGIDIKAQAYRLMFVSGAVSGLVGAIEILAVHGRYVDTSLTRPLYAWTGVMAALLANSSVVGAIVAGLFFAFLQNGGFGMERATDVPRELARVVQAVIIILVAVGTRMRFGSGNTTNG